MIPREACLLLNQFVREAQTAMAAMASGKRQVTTAEVLDEILRDSDLTFLIFLTWIVEIRALSLKVKVILITTGGTCNHLRNILQHLIK